MDRKIKQLTASYIYEGLIGCLWDAVIIVVMFVAALISGINIVVALVCCVVMAIAFMAMFDWPIMIKCLLDRKNQTILTATGTFEDMLPDKNWSYKNRPPEGFSDSLSIWYYPKSWVMERYKFLLKTTDGRSVKARSVFSAAHGQNDLVDVIGIGKHYDSPLLLQLRYLKYSKVLIDVRIVSYPPDMKMRTLEYVQRQLADITRWTAKSHE
jgi:hypothetical protein